VVNLELSVPPGTTQRLMIPFEGVFPDPLGLNATPGDLWLRMTWTDMPVDENITAGQGGWDGSGAFPSGETEDYLLFYSAAPGAPGNTPNVTLLPGPPSPGAWFKKECIPCPLKLDHCSSGQVAVRVTVVDPMGTGAYATLNNIKVDPIGPAFGLSIDNGAKPGDVGGASVQSLPDGILVTVPITPACDPPGRIQSFGIRFSLAGWGPGGKIWGASKTCGVLVYHGYYPRFGELAFDPNLFPAYTPIAVPADDGGPPVGYVVFGNNQPTPGVVSMVQLEGEPPIAATPGTAILPTMSLVDVNFFSEGHVDPEWPEVETEIVGLHLGGYTDEMVWDAGIPDEMMLQPFRVPYYPDAQFDIQDEVTLDVGDLYFIDPGMNMVMIENPRGFSIWGFQGPVPLPGDCDGDGDVDQNDFVQMEPCLMGPGGGLPGGCECFDLDGSGGVDLLDFGRFQEVFTGGI
jgi:hypothetical protein